MKKTNLNLRIPFSALTIFISILIITANLLSGCGNKEFKERDKLEAKYNLALEKKDFTIAFETLYKLKAHPRVGSYEIIDYTKSMMTVRIPYLLFDDEYKIALREFAEFNYVDIYNGYSEDYDFANNLLGKIFYNAIENLDFEYAQKALKYYRFHYPEQYGAGLGGHKDDHNQDILNYDNLIIQALLDQKDRIDVNKRVKYFMQWAKPPIKFVVPDKDGGTRFIYNEDRPNITELKKMSNKLK